jgi:two-component system sensor histidine kinase VanS
MSLNKHKTAPIYASHKKVARKNTLQCLAAIIIVGVLLAALAFTFLIVIENFNMYSPGFYNAAMSFFKIFMIPCLMVTMLASCCYITYRFMLRPLSYLEQLAQAAKQLASPTEAPISLPEDLEDIEKNLNEVREHVIESQKAAQTANQRKDDLLIYLAHDLKTPLTSVLGYMKLIEDEPTMPAESISRYAAIARAKAERLEELINEFFEITRFSTSNLSLESMRVNLSRMLMQITSEFNPTLADKGLTWDLKIPEGIEIVCDPDKLERAIDNIVRNAVIYSYEKSVLQFALSPTNDGVEISIQNQGRTIPQEKLKRIFEQFYRVDTSRSSDTGGAGLGLAIAKEIIELHHGTITAYSADETIRFVMHLPSDCQKIV